jgi:Fic/DOC family
LLTALASLDAAVPVGAAVGQAELMAVLRLMALVHGEWVRIHPFANGNGRTARVWANWTALRYGLPAFVRLKPRPAHLLYAGAAAASMRGDHDPMIVALHSMLRDYLMANSPSP